MTGVLGKVFYIRLVEGLLLLYGVFYCIAANEIWLIPIHIALFGIIIIMTGKSISEISIVRLCYICFCIHAIENDLYQIFSETNNKYIFVICTLIIILMNNRHGIGDIGKTVWSHMILDLIVTCQCFGYACFVIAKYKDAKLAACLFCLLMFWCHGLVELVFRLFSYSSRWLKKDESESLKVGQICMVLFFIVFGTGIFFSIAFYPGIITPDNIYFYETALNGSLYGASDIHSFAYLCVFKAVISICDNYYIITILLLSFFAAAWACIFSYLYRKGLSKKAAIVITILWILFPSNIHMMIASWKDIPFTICMLILTYQLLKNYFDNTYGDKLRNLLVLSAALFGTAVFRSNGQVVLLVMVIFFGIAYVKKKVKLKLLVSILISLFAVILFKGPVFHYFNVQQSPSNYSALPFMDGIVEYVYKGNELDDETAEYFYSLTTYDDCMEHYTSYNFDIGMFYNGYGSFDLKKASKGYLKCILQHPIETISGRFKRTFNIWSIFYNENFPISKFIYSDVWSNEYEWQYIELMKPLRNMIINLYSEKHLLGTVQSIFYRGGWNLLLWMCSLAYLSGKKKKMAYALVPITANTAGLFLGCCFPDYRYIYPMFVITVPYISAILMSDGRS